MPYCMQNFTVVVQVVDTDLVPPSPVGLTRDNLVVEYLPQLCHVPRCLVTELVLVVTVKNSEEVIV